MGTIRHHIEILLGENKESLLAGGGAVKMKESA
jgi:hypothetical protein